MFLLLSKIFDGATISDTNLGRFCNSTRPPTLTSSQNVVLIHFHSDDVIDDTSGGFYVRVSGFKPGWFVLGYCCCHPISILALVHLPFHVLVPHHQYHHHHHYLLLHSMW